MTIGEKLKSLRKQNRMTLEDVANYINVGRATVLKYENGMITNIPSDKIEHLAFQPCHVRTRGSLSTGSRCEHTKRDRLSAVLF